MSSQPRGIRNNNPGNIRIGASWVGLAVDQSDPAFCVFREPAYGIRAIARILRNYQANGINTVAAMVARWAPPSENTTSAYVSAVAHACDVPSDTVISLIDYLPRIIPAIIREENGQQPYDTETIAKGIALA